MYEKKFAVIHKVIEKRSCAILTTRPLPLPMARLISEISIVGYYPVFRLNLIL